jgi:hypothetical protein
MAQRRAPAAQASKKWALSEVIRVKIRGAAKALVVVVTSCVSMIPATTHKEAQSTAQTALATKDGRADIDAHVAEWLKENDVPSVAVAYIQIEKWRGLRCMESRVRESRRLKKPVQRCVSDKANNGGDNTATRVCKKTLVG